MVVPAQPPEVARLRLQDRLGRSAASRQWEAAGIGSWLRFRAGNALGFEVRLDRRVEGDTQGRGRGACGDEVEKFGDVSEVADFCGARVMGRATTPRDAGVGDGIWGQRKPSAQLKVDHGRNEQAAVRVAAMQRQAWARSMAVG